MDVNYVKKSRDEKYKLVYSLTPDYLSYFNETNLEDLELKKFISNVSDF
jgi:hypothetical protein